MKISNLYLTDISDIVHRFALNSRRVFETKAVSIFRQKIRGRISAYWSLKKEAACV